MPKKYTIKLMHTRRSGGTLMLVLEATVVSNDFDEHDTAGVLFSSEFAINGHSHETMPVRCYIQEMEEK